MASLSHAAELKLPLVFSDHMVFQHGIKAPIWGWADAGSDVSITFQGQSLTAKADASGKWQAAFAPLKVSAEAAQMNVKSGDQTVTVSDILVGEVWLCSGQSNMEWSVKSSDNAEQEIANANYPLIRHIKPARNPQMFPQDAFKDAAWTVCTPENVPGWTAVGYFFGHHLHKELNNVPIGLLNCSWGGTRIEPWTPRIGFQLIKETNDIFSELLVKDPSTDQYKQLANNYLKAVSDWLEASKKNVIDKTTITQPPAYPQEIVAYTSHQSPTMLYNGMVNPLVPFAIKGSIWYQGESNHGEGMRYVDKTKALVEGWRNVWGIKDLPYYYVQIAPYQYGSEDPKRLADFWVAQAEIETQIPNTGMVVVSDIGNLKNIHPTNKQDVGKRLANFALVKDYGKTGIVYHGPAFKSMKTEADKIVLTFDHVGSGLASRDDKPLNEFQIGSAEKTWTDANATITGKDTVEVSADGVTNPVVVRFAYHKLATPNLMNKEGLPAQTFMAGEIPNWDSLSKNVEESTKYELMYDMDLTKLNRDVNYSVNNAKDYNGKFSRIAYYLELGNSQDDLQWVYVSMDAFTNDVNKIGIPKFGTKAEFQTNVKNMNVYSNVESLKTGMAIEGNIEFWPNNYAATNITNVPGASNSSYDFGDQISTPADGYGSMQVHNTKQKQTIFALNKWTNGNNADLGIGNSTGTHSDWTFSNAGKNYSIKRLRVLILPAN
jgi:sialate O-acetylesterase